MGWPKKELSIVWGVTKFHFTRKFLMMAFVPFIAMAVGYSWTITATSLVYLAAFFLAYSSIYFVNDIIDQEKDKEKTFYYSSKKLANGEAELRDYLNFGYLTAILGLTASFLLNSWFGFLVFLNLLIAHFRHHISGLLLRTLALGVLEFVNLAALTLIFAPISVLADWSLSLLYIVLCVLYMFLYAAYRYRNGKQAVKLAVLGVAAAVLVLGLHIVLFSPNLLPLAVVVPLAIGFAGAWIFTMRLNSDTLMSLTQLGGGLVLALLANYWVF